MRAGIVVEDTQTTSCSTDKSIIHVAGFDSTCIPTSSSHDWRLVIRQSKSLRLFLFPAHKLADSCGNLVEFTRSGEGFVLPEGGVEQGLRGKMVALRRKS